MTVKRSRIRFIIGALFVLGAFSAHANSLDAPLVPMKYERIVDGDTFYASGKKIRVWGIDAPEKNHVLYFASTLFLETLLKDGTLECRQVDIDRYKRLVMQCFSDGHDVAKDMVRFGMATDFKRYSNGHYDLMENEAKTNKRGLWSLDLSDEL